MIGGATKAAFRRVREYGDGWTVGGGGPDDFASGVDQARSAWRQAGRQGGPRLIALGYFALGDGAREKPGRIWARTTTSSASRSPA